MLNLYQKTKRESQPAFFGSSPQPMSFMRLQRLYIRTVEVYRQKFRVFSGKAYKSLSEVDGAKGLMCLHDDSGELWAMGR